MGGLTDTFTTLMEDPSQNFTAVGIAIAIAVLTVIAFVLVLVWFAIPHHDEEEGERDPQLVEQERQFRRVRAASLAVVIVVAMMSAWAAAVVWHDATSTNDYCTRVCHSMVKPAQAWVASAHSGVDCIRCHEDSDLGSLPSSIASRARSLVYEWTGTSGPGTPVPERRCLSCHHGILEVSLTARNGEPFTHGESSEEDRACVSCHGEQGHVPPRSAEPTDTLEP